jgi:hypothetical protein
MNTLGSKEREFLLNLSLKDELPKNNEGLNTSLITDFIIDSRIEYHLLTIGDEKLLKKILGDDLFKKIKLENFKKAIPTLKNIDMSIKIAKKLNNSGIKYTFLKGINCQNIGDRFIRPSRDIDLLIDKDDIPKSVTIFKKLGFRFINHEFFSKDMITSFNGKYDLPVMKTTDGINLEIHYKIIRDQQSTSCSFSKLLLEKNTQLLIGNHKLPTLSNEYLIIHLIYHGTKKGSFDVGLSTFIDIRRIQKRGPVNWDEVRSLSKKFGFEYYSKLIEATLDENQNNEISNEDIEDFKYLFTLPILNSKFFEIDQKKSFLSKLSEIHSTIFVKKEVVLRDFEVKDRIFLFLFYLRRWFRQSGLLLRQIVQLIANKTEIKKKFELIKKFSARN